ncbi:MAG: hypothetical protein F4Y20_08050 [Acidobacteria bacterium]|nr:hypothetical protein [Acidobacteriota bacterium]MYH23162.1 hypothetical protein [Acidobacteriota bacterium]
MLTSNAMAWKGWQPEVLECIAAFCRETGNLHFSVDDIYGRHGKDLEKRSPSRDHIDRTIRGSIRAACRQLAKKGVIIKVGDKGINYQLPGPPAVERFDLPEEIDQTAKQALAKKLDTSEDPQAALTGTVLALVRAVVSLQRRCTVLEERLRAGGAPTYETSDAEAPAPLDTSATLHGGLQTPVDEEPGQSRFPQLARSAGALIRGFLQGS